MAYSNSWHKDMYDETYARSTIGSSSFANRAKEEVEFIVRALALPKGAAILDIPCGTGRHSVLLAKKGYRVVGADISKACLKLAKTHRSSAEFRFADMANLRRFRGQFDATINMFTSFGYFATDAQNEKVLDELISTLKPGGRLLLNLINRNYLEKIFSEGSFHVDGDEVTVEARNYNPKTRYNESWVTVVNRKTGKGSALYHRIRLYTPDEIEKTMKRAGLKEIRVFGDFRGAKLSNNSSHPIIVGIRK